MTLARSTETLTIITTPLDRTGARIAFGTIAGREENYFLPPRVCQRHNISEASLGAVLLVGARHAAPGETAGLVENVVKVVSAPPVMPRLPEGAALGALFDRVVSLREEVENIEDMIEALMKG